MSEEKSSEAIKDKMLKSLGEDYADYLIRDTTKPVSYNYMTFMK